MAKKKAKKPAKAKKAAKKKPAAKIARKPAKKAAKKTAKRAAPQPAAKKAAKPKAAQKAKSAKKAKGPKKPPAGPRPLPWRQPQPGEVKLGVVDDYFSHLCVMTMKLDAPISLGERIHVHGHTTDLLQTVDSMQIAHQSVQQANAGDSVGIKVNDKCRAGDYVWKLP